MPIKHLLRCRLHAQQDDMFLRIRSEFEFPDTRPLDVSHAVIARNTDVNRAKMHRLVKLALAAKIVCRSRISGRLAVGRVEDSHPGVVTVLRMLSSRSLSKPVTRMVGLLGLTIPFGLSR